MTRTSETQQAEEYNEELADDSESGVVPELATNTTQQPLKETEMSTLRLDESSKLVERKTKDKQASKPPHKGKKEAGRAGGHRDSRDEKDI